MIDRKRLAMGILTLMVVLGSMPAMAQEEFSFTKRKIKTVYPGGCQFVPCASVQFQAPSDGYVVVTASGMASFHNDISFLELTISPKRASRGPWLFNLTPGYNFYQTYCVRMVFPVEAGVSYTYYLNGRSCDGPGGPISVETGSMTAEFYSQEETQEQPAQSSPEEETQSSDARVVNRN